MVNGKVNQGKKEYYICRLLLHWNEGNLWRTQIPFREYFEFKYIFLEGDKVKKWEGGDNRVFNYELIKNTLENSNINKEGKIFIENIFPEDIVYDHNQSKLKIISKWKY